MDLAIQEGFIPFRNFKTWYRVVGDLQTAKYPALLCLHGGPGMSHDYLETLEEVAKTGRPVIFYDQLGCGKSDHPHDPSLWKLELFVEELIALRQFLGLETIHLFGQSWGGFLAQEYLLTGPNGVMSLILSNSAASTRRWISEANRLRSELPLDIQLTLEKHEAAGTTADPAYVSAAETYNRRYFCRLKPWPDCLLRTLDNLNKDPEVYNSMWGPSEFHCTGSLQNWDIENQINAIRIPTLILSGRFDESTPSINTVLHNKIPNSEWVVFEESSHTPHLEETAMYMRVLNDFLTRVERK